ncbi:MAG: hypothetical protein LBF84_02230 [Holosporales bacterium]|nr:hypothetical protein [Holosporales bacterium]
MFSKKVAPLLWGVSATSKPNVIELLRKPFLALAFCGVEMAFAIGLLYLSSFTFQSTKDSGPISAQNHGFSDRTIRHL